MAYLSHRGLNKPTLVKKMKGKTAIKRCYYNPKITKQFLTKLRNEIAFKEKPNNKPRIPKIEKKH